VCMAGYYGSGGDIACVACGVGTYKIRNGNNEYLSCPQSVIGMLGFRCDLYGAVGKSRSHKREVPWLSPSPPQIPPASRSMRVHLHTPRWELLRQHLSDWCSDHIEPAGGINPALDLLL
jgi:hypothetical protein